MVTKKEKPNLLRKKMQTTATLLMFLEKKVQLFCSKRLNKLSVQIAPYKCKKIRILFDM